MTTAWGKPEVPSLVRTPAGVVAYDDRGTGSAVVLVHGLGGDASHFDQVAPALARRHRVIGVDLPGCGRSGPSPGRHSVRRCAEAVLGVMDALGVERAALVGHSAGGQVVAEAAALAPARVSRLVLVASTGLVAYARPLHWLARAVFQPGLVRRALAPGAGLLMSQVFQARTPDTERFAERWAASLRPPRTDSMADVFHGLMPDLMTPSVVTNAARLTMPVLALWGDRDRLVPVAGARRAGEVLGDCRVEVLPGCGHLPIVEAHERAGAILAGFLDNDEALKMVG